MKTIDRTCAIAYSINLLGDKWSLLILRDVILHKKSKFKEFIDSKEKIATNILSNRLKFLVEEGFLELLDPKGFKKNKQYLARYCLFFLNPLGSKSSKKPSSTKNFNLLERMLVAIFSFESINSLNLDFLCNMTSLKIKRDHLSPKRLIE